MCNIEKSQHTTNISTATKIASQRKNTTAQKLLTPLSVFSPKSREELDSAIDDCLNVSSKSNRPMRLHGPIGKWDVSQVTDMSRLFYTKDTFNYDLSSWDVSRVTNMREIFFFAVAFNQDLSNGDLSRVNDMGAMFVDANSFNQDLSKWDVSCVTDMGSMFLDADSFNQDLSKWDVSRVTDMGAMFLDATSFNQDLSKWDVSRVIDMQSMFERTPSFQQTLCGAAWVNSNASKSDMFKDSPGCISNTVCGVCMFWSFFSVSLLSSFSYPTCSHSYI